MARRRKSIEKEILAEVKKEERLSEEVLREVRHLEHPRLSSIRIRFTHHHQSKGNKKMPPVQGPVILTEAGAVATASILGFDQFGAPMPTDFVMPAVTFSSDDTADAIVTFADNGDGTATVTAVANGVANVSASLTTEEGVSLSDTETVTVAIVVPPPPTPVLSSIKIAFTTATSGAAPAIDTRTPNQKLQG